MPDYRFKPDPYLSHMRLISGIRRMGRKDLKILDVGCSKGFMGKVFHKDHELTGLEINEEDAKIARRFYKEIQIIDLERDVPKLKDNYFDVVLMADVIEHIKNSFEVVNEYKRYMKRDGVMIISVPNFANVYIRLKVFLGIFDYDEKGPLDKTHIRFFTLNSFRRLIKKAGMRIEREEFTPLPLPLVSPLFARGNILSFVHHFYYLLVLVWKRMFANQIIVYCKK